MFRFGQIFFTDILLKMHTKFVCMLHWRLGKIYAKNIVQEKILPQILVVTNKIVVNV